MPFGFLGVFPAIASTSLCNAFLFAANSAASACLILFSTVCRSSLGFVGAAAAEAAAAVAAPAAAAPVRPS